MARSARRTVALSFGFIASTRGARASVGDQPRHQRRRSGPGLPAGVDDCATVRRTGDRSSGGRVRVPGLSQPLRPRRGLRRVSRRRLRDRGSIRDVRSRPRSGPGEDREIPSGLGLAEPPPPARLLLDLPALVEERFFGEEGLNQIAVGANASFPAGERGEFAVAFDVLRGTLSARITRTATRRTRTGPCRPAPCASAPGAMTDLQPGRRRLRPGLLRARGGRARGRRSGARVPAGRVVFQRVPPLALDPRGANALLGTLDPALDREVRWLGADVKYRYRPDKYARSTSSGLAPEPERPRDGDRHGDGVPRSRLHRAICPEGGVCMTVDQTEHAKGARSRPPRVSARRLAVRPALDAGISSTAPRGCRAPTSSSAPRRSSTSVSWRSPPFSGSSFAARTAISTTSPTSRRRSSSFSASGRTVRTSSEEDRIMKRSHRLLAAAFAA